MNHILGRLNGKLEYPTSLLHNAGTVFFLSHNYYKKKIIKHFLRSYFVQRLISSSYFFQILANFKLTVSDIKGKSITKELKDADTNSLLGLAVGSETDASIVGLTGKLKITGGSDKSGVPMRPDFHGPARKYLLLSKGVGLQDTEKGLRKRKLLEEI